MEEGITTVSPSLLDDLNQVLGLETADIRSYSALTLAYLGDCIYELIIRTLLVENGISHVSKLHKEASRRVKASAQNDMFHAVEDILTEEELSAYKRGRNVKSSTVAKHASVTDYRSATGYEAMLGYLYLMNRTGRILELIKRGLTKLELL